MSSNKRAAVKVVLMDTQYVQTDPRSFKSVVQKLTGKDSCVAWIKESSSAGSERGTLSSDHGNVKLEDGNEKSVSKIMLSKGMSFKDLDRMMLEAPPPEELQWLWNEYSMQH